MRLLLQEFYRILICHKERQFTVFGITTVDARTAIDRRPHSTPGTEHMAAEAITADRAFVSCVRVGTTMEISMFELLKELTAIRGPSQLIKIAADTLGWSLSGSGFSASLTFDYRDVAVGRHICEAFSSSSRLWPFDLEPIHLGSLA